MKQLTTDIKKEPQLIILMITRPFVRSDGASPVVPAVLHTGLRSEPHLAQEHRHLRCPLQPGQGARPHPETVCGQDPRLQQQEQVSW